ncbi:Integral membrane protein [Lachnospiraceae bacterium TWA4]|nr:Integral membrane protein [Lachnospiraceae bacterium TWA4]
MFKRLFSILVSISFLIVLLLTSVQVAVYSDRGFFEKEYEKYQVLDDVHMTMDDLMQVTDKLLGYMIGDKDDLVIETTISGQTREFFNEREKMHMVDVRDLFIKGYWMRNILAIFVLIGVVILRRQIVKIFLATTGITVIISVILGLIISRDFYSAFILFHKILFTQNDFWLLNPETDLLINIVPEGFFMDMALRIGLIFGVSLLVLIGLGLCILILERKKAINESKN